VSGRDLASVVGDIRQSLAPVEEQLRKLPGGYRIEYSGQFQAQEEAHAVLVILVPVAVLGVFLLLWSALGSWVAAIQVLLVNIPLAALGSVIILLLLNWPTAEALEAAPWWEWPRVWAQATTLSLAHWVGFIALIGIVSRNGIMMISHYLHLMRYEGEKFDEHMLIRGSIERLAPVLMTAFVAVIGLVPLALGAGQTGKELLHPLAIVVIGGLLDSTVMDQVVTPAVFLLFGRLHIRLFGSNPYVNEAHAGATSEAVNQLADRWFPVATVDAKKAPAVAADEPPAVKAQAAAAH
jgi:Cu/Ag efflux pump CusA